MIAENKIGWTKILDKIKTINIPYGEIHIKATYHDGQLRNYSIGTVEKFQCNSTEK